MALRFLWLFLLTVALTGAGCGSDSAPAALESPEEADRYRGLQEARNRSGDQVLVALFQVAEADPNEFLRAQALGELAARLPPGDAPPGFLAALLRASTEDPDLNRRYAGILMLHFKQTKVLREVAQVYAESPSATTRRALAEAAAQILTPEQLSEVWDSPRGQVRQFAQEAAWIQVKLRRGGHY